MPGEEEGVMRYSQCDHSAEIPRKWIFIEHKQTREDQTPRLTVLRFRVSGTRRMCVRACFGVDEVRLWRSLGCVLHLCKENRMRQLEKLSLSHRDLRGEQSKAH